MWLQGKSVRLVGESPAIAAALAEQGAQFVEAGPCDILVHVATAPVRRLAHELSAADWRRTLDEGLDQRFRLARDFAIERQGRRRPGAVLFVGAPEQAAGADQAAAGGALGNLTKTLGVEWARDGIRVNSIQTCETGDTLAHLAAYLVSDYAAYITGAVVGVGLADT